MHEELNALIEFLKRNNKIFTDYTYYIGSEVCNQVYTAWLVLQVGCSQICFLALRCLAHDWLTKLLSSLVKELLFMQPVISSLSNRAACPAGFEAAGG